MALVNFDDSDGAESVSFRGPIRFSAIFGLHLGARATDCRRQLPKVIIMVVFCATIIILIFIIMIIVAVIR